MTNLKKAAFIDHSFHQKTKTSDFFKDIISKKYDITVIWDNSWKNKYENYINKIKANDYQTIFFWQSILPAKSLERLSCENIIWIPMYDQEANKPLHYYLPYLKLNIKIISFSKVLYRRFKKIGFNVYYYQYFLEQKKKIDQGNKINIFFWQRHAEINWDLIKKLLKGNNINSVIIKNSPDPYQKINMPSQDDINKYNIKIINGWLGGKNYDELMSKCNVFIAPRKYEGIGVSFLEAIASSMIVVAPDNPTMNEYIINKQTGYLYNIYSPRAIKINLSIIKNIAEYSQKGYQEWSKKKNDILTDIEKKNIQTNNPFLSLYISIYSFIYDFFNFFINYWIKAINKLKKIWIQKYP